MTRPICARIIRVSSRGRPRLPNDGESRRSLRSTEGINSDIVMNWLSTNAVARGLARSGCRRRTHKIASVRNSLWIFGIRIFRLPTYMTRIIIGTWPSCERYNRYLLPAKLNAAKWRKLIFQTHICTYIWTHLYTEKWEKKTSYKLRRA